jgi:hypothetical protein
MEGKNFVIIVGGLLLLNFIPYQDVNQLFMASVCLYMIGCYLVIHYHETFPALYGPTQQNVIHDEHLNSDKYYIHSFILINLRAL